MKQMRTYSGSLVCPCAGALSAVGDKAGAAELMHEIARNVIAARTDDLRYMVGNDSAE